MIAFLRKLFSPRPPRPTSVTAVAYYFIEPRALLEGEEVVTDPADIEQAAKSQEQWLAAYRRWRAGERGSWGTFYHPASGVPDPTPEEVEQQIVEGEKLTRSETRTMCVRKTWTVGR